MLPYIISDFSATVVCNNKTYSITSDHPSFKNVVKLLKTNQFKDVYRLLDIPSFISERTRNLVKVRNGVVYWRDKPVHNYVATKIMAMTDQGHDPKFLMNFLENVYKNPSQTARDELFIFLENSSLPITKDGHFLAYKRISDDYVDFYTRKISHSVGKVVKMERSKVDPVRDNTCSTGLHFCSLSYLPHYHSNEGRIVIVKINPKHVVSIPSDYDNAKGRACEYRVVAEYEGDENAHAFDVEVVGRLKKAIKKTK